MAYLLSPLAGQDLEEIWLYVAEDSSPTTADRLIDAIVDRFDRRLAERERERVGPRILGPIDTGLPRSDLGGLTDTEGGEDLDARVSLRLVNEPDVRRDTTGQFSPTARYRDYAISRELIHWESQSSTRADSETGQRYRRHRELGTSVMLFARLRSDERAFWFLGPASYVSHESELPMAITWRLQHLLPGDLFAQFAAAVA